MEPGGILTSPLSPCPLCPQLRNLITDVSQHKLLVFAGPCVEETGELMLQTGCFSLRDFIQIFTDKEVRGQGWPETPRKELLPPPRVQVPQRGSLAPLLVCRGGAVGCRCQSCCLLTSSGVSAGSRARGGSTGSRTGTSLLQGWGGAVGCILVLQLGVG